MTALTYAIPQQNPNLVYTTCLEKLGEALYTHAKKAVEADNAFTATEYLASNGIFNDLVDTTLPK